MLQTFRRRATSVLVIGLIALLLTPYVPTAGHAAGGGSSDIRVTLLISSLGTVPSVTLQSSSALSVSLQRGDGTGPLLTAEAGVPVRFSPTGYALIVQETDNYNTALQAYQAAVPYGHPEIMSDFLQGRPVYQVRLGGFANRAEAEAAAARLPRAETGSLRVSGPLYASAGTFATAEEAAQLKATLQQHGIRAWHVLHPDAAGFGTHSVWIGAAAGEAELEEAIASAVQLFPGIVPHRVDGTGPYLLNRHEEVPGQAGTVNHYEFNRNGQEVRVAGADGSFITVKERYGRTYRGIMALTVYEGKLAVINELPLEQYLYAVVGSEMPASWPHEALKAQAVAARTFALKRGVKFGIAHISDTTNDQAYHGIGAESPASIAAVEDTRGEVLANAAGLVDPYYASNHGGHSADPSEVWTGTAPHVKFVASPDEIAERGRLDWYRIMLADGTSGYIRSDLATITGLKTDIGLPIIEVSGDNVNIRRAPRVDNTDNPAIAQANSGDRFVMIGQDVESNPYSWIRGAYDADRVKSTINARATSAVQGDLLTLEVSARGPSGRVTEVKANGQPVKLAYPDQHRGALGGLPSTLFDIEETGRYTVLAALGAKREFPEPGGSLTVLSATGTNPLSSGEFYVMDSEGSVRAATTEPRFRFVGRGYGHGLGMSQYGARALAEAGYDYKAILAYYYDGIRIEKE